MGKAGGLRPFTARQPAAERGRLDSKINHNIDHTREARALHSGTKWSCFILRSLSSSALRALEDKLEDKCGAMLQPLSPRLRQAKSVKAEKIFMKRG